MKTRAAVAWKAGEPLAIETIDIEGPKAGEVLVEIKATGICHTDAYTLSGADPEGIFPAILGHEGAGAVREVGAGVTSVKVGDHVEHTAAVGNGPVNALDHALRKALEKFYPQLKEMKLLDYKVRVLAANKGTAARVRVLIESGDRTRKWGTVGVSQNIIEASWQALVDSIEYKLLQDRKKKR